MTRLIAGVLVLLLAGCGSGVTSSATTISVTAPPSLTTQSCTLPPASYEVLRACEGQSTQLELKIAESMDGKTTARIAVKSKDPEAILAAMGAFMSEWDAGARSFTVWAYGSARDARRGGYNRGVLFYNNDGPVTIRVCTAFEKLEGVDFCTDEDEYVIPGRG